MASAQLDPVPELKPLYEMFPTLDITTVNQAYTSCGEKFEEVIDYLLGFEKGQGKCLGEEGALPPTNNNVEKKKKSSTSKERKSRKDKKERKRKSSKESKKKEKKISSAAKKEEEETFCLEPLYNEIKIPFPVKWNEQPNALLSLTSKSKMITELGHSKEENSVHFTLKAKKKTSTFILILPETRKGDYMLYKGSEMENLGSSASLLAIFNKVLRRFGRERKIEIVDQFIPLKIPDHESDNNSVDRMSLTQSYDSLAFEIEMESDFSIEFDEEEDGFSANPDSQLVHDPEKNPNEIDPEVSFLPPTEELKALVILNELQAKAVQFVVKRSCKLSKAAYPAVLKRVKSLGFADAEMALKKTMRYIRDEAPIIMHFPLNVVLPKLMKDTHLRNQFETGTSRGSLNKTSRKGWEDNCFNKIYANSSGFERVKYGVLNIVNDPKGVKSCSGYGDSFFLLKKVRLRTSFASSDTSCQQVKIASCEYYCHVLEKYSDAELRAVVEVGTGAKPFLDSSCITTYKEIQIHGEVKLNEHIQSIHPNPNYKSDSNMKQMIEDFAAKNKCDIVWQDALK